MKRITNLPIAGFLTVIKNLMLLLALTLVLSSCDKEEEMKAPLQEGDAPDFSLSSLDGKQVKLADYSNKVVVLFFFGNNCPSCKAASPNVESMLVAPFAGRSDYQILGLDQWNGNSSAVQAFKTITGVSFPLLLNASEVASDYKTTYDRLVVIDKSGNIVFSGTQGVSADIAAVKQKVEMLLGAQSITPIDTTVVKGVNAPDFTLNSILGSSIKLSSYSKKVVVLFFLGNNCPACKSVAPSVESKLVTPFALRTDYQVLGLDQWDGNQTSLEAFKTLTRVSFPLLLNASAVASSYKTTYDRLVVIDKDGTIAFNGSQGAAADIEAVKLKVELLLSK